MELRRHLDLAQKALGGDRIRDFWLEHLHRDLTLERVIEGEVHARHPTLAELPDNRIAGSQRLDQRRRNQRLLREILQYRPDIRLDWIAQESVRGIREVPVRRRHLTMAPLGRAGRDRERPAPSTNRA